jgi:EpsI family protein
MFHRRFHIIMASLAMLAVTAAARVLAPQPAVHPRQYDLSSMIPRQIGAWSYVPTIGLITAPAGPADVVQDAAQYGGIYSQIVGRGYRDSSGHVLMLLVAYGAAQDARLKAHRPEFCYVASGFRILDKSASTLTVDGRHGALPLIRLIAERETRLEPVSYWMRVGDVLSHGPWDRQLIRLEYGLRGVVPDGALFRVSTVGLEPEASFALQEQFIRDLLSTVPPRDLPFFIGKGSEGLEPRVTAAANAGAATT